MLLLHDNWVSDLRALSKKCVEYTQVVSQQLLQKHWMLTTAESCTGGWVAKICTDQPGSSAWFDGGILCYSNRSKNQFLGIPQDIIGQHGAVSEPITEAMVSALLLKSQAQVGVAISGIAGPEGGTKEKPVGMVCFSWQRVDQDVCSSTAYFEGSRVEVRLQSVFYALSGLKQILV